ncbi:MAG: GtrA family protein [bacterium]
MREILRQFTQRESHPFVQFIKYGMCGVIATGVHFICFYLFATLLFPAIGTDDPAAGFLRWIGLPVTDVALDIRSRNYVIDTVMGFFFSNLTAYILNILWVFKSGRHHWVMEIALFYAVSGASMGIGCGFAFLLIKGLGLSTTVAFLANIITSTMINYAMRKYVIFKG